MNINKFTDKQLTLILKQLNIRERIELRRVSNRFKKLIDETITDLIISNNYEFEIHWKFSNDLVDLNAITFDFSYCSLIFKNIKRIRFQNSLLIRRIAILNEFENLEQLEIGFILLTNDVTLSLNNLRTLYIGKIASSSPADFNFYIQAPKLRKIFLSKLIDLLELLIFYSLILDLVLELLVLDLILELLILELLILFLI